MTRSGSFISRSGGSVSVEIFDDEKAVLSVVISISASVAMAIIVGSPGNIKLFFNEGL